MLRSLLVGLGEVVADRGFGEPDRFGQLATVDFAGLRTEQYGHDLDPDRVSGALSRRATWRASSSAMGPAATGAQHTGVDMSIVGRALGTIRSCHEIDIYQKVAQLR